MLFDFKKILSKNKIKVDYMESTQSMSSKALSLDHDSLQY